METREIKITLETARRLYEQDGEMKEIALCAFTEQELVGDRLPKTWDEYCAQEGSKGLSFKAGIEMLLEDIIHYKLTNCKDAKAYIAFVKLRLLRDEYRNEWLPNWYDGTDKWYIRRLAMYNGDNIMQFDVTQSICVSSSLSFQTKELADEFLNNFRDLIVEAGDLI